MTDFATLEVSTPSDTEIVMTRSFAAPRQVVFDAWTRPELLAVLRVRRSSTHSTVWLPTRSRARACPKATYAVHSSCQAQRTRERSTAIGCTFRRNTMRRGKQASWSSMTGPPT